LNTSLGKGKKKKRGGKGNGENPEKIQWEKGQGGDQKKRGRSWRGGSILAAVVGLWGGGGDKQRSQGGRRKGKKR